MDNQLSDYVLPTRIVLAAKRLLDPEEGIEIVRWPNSCLADTAMCGGLIVPISPTL